MTKEKRYKELLKKVNECGKTEKCDKLSPCEECQQINMWSYWQGGINHLNAKILLVGQDWGDVKDAKEIIKRFNFEKDNYPENYCVFVDENESILKTDPNLIKLFDSIGYDIRLDQKDLFFTNLVLCYRENGYSGDFRQSWATNCGTYLKELVDIIKPKVILCLGRGTYEGVMKALGGKAEKGSYNEIIDEHTPSEAGGYKVFPLAHCGSMGTANRNKDKDKHKDKLHYQKEDWKAIQKYL